MASCVVDPATNLLHIFILIIIMIGILVGFAGNYIQSNEDRTTNGNTTAFIGNILAMVGLVTLIPIIIAVNTKCSTSGTSSNVFYDFIVHPGPAIVTIIVIGYNAAINMLYKDLLLKHSISTEYYRYSLLFSILLIVQFVFLGKYMSEYISGIGSESIWQYVVYLLATVNFFLLSVMQIILKFFSTDG